MNSKSKANLIYLSRLPKNLRDLKQPKADKPVEAKENRYVKMRRLMDSVEKSSLIFGEALSVPEAQAWLNRAYQTIVNRSETINSLPEREEYTKLANLIQTATPISNATAESVESNLQILRQQIQVGEEDSHALRTLKQHLITSIGEVLSPPTEETPDSTVPPEGMGEEPPPGQQNETPPSPNPMDQVPQ